MPEVNNEKEEHERMQARLMEKLRGENLVHIMSVRKGTLPKLLSRINFYGDRWTVVDYQIDAAKRIYDVLALPERKVRDIVDNFFENEK